MNRKQVLIVEDDPDLSEIMETTLSAVGYVCIRTDKLADAVFKLNNQKFDAIVLDMHIKQGSGEQVIETVRNNDKAINRKTPILVSSGELDSPLVKRIAGKVNGVLAKPFEQSVMLEKLKTLMGE